MSTASTMNQIAKTASAGTKLVDKSGHSYTVERVLRERERPLQCVYLATYVRETSEPAIFRVFNY